MAPLFSVNGYRKWVHSLIEMDRYYEPTVIGWHPVTQLRVINSSQLNNYSRISKDLQSQLQRKSATTEFKHDCSLCFPSQATWARQSVSLRSPLNKGTCHYCYYLKSQNIPNTLSKCLIDTFDVKLFQHGILLTVDAASACTKNTGHGWADWITNGLNHYQLIR